MGGVEARIVVGRQRRFLKIPRWDEHASIPFTLGTGVRPSQGGHEENPADAADRRGKIGYWAFKLTRLPPLLS
jgi:hypothetical protein